MAVRESRYNWMIQIALHFVCACDVVASLFRHFRFKSYKIRAFNRQRVFASAEIDFLYDILNGFLIYYLPHRTVSSG